MLLTYLSFLIWFSHAQNFFADPTIQRELPQAFVLQPEAQAFHNVLLPETQPMRDELVRQLNFSFGSQISNWRHLEKDEKLVLLRKIFTMQVQVMGIQAPELVIDATAIPGRAAFFEFDLEQMNTGRVFLNPEVLETMDPYASLSLLIHETRHSAQLQMLYDHTAHSELKKSFGAAFKAQGTLKIRSFCDFLTLANEYEAFQFSNYVLGKLTQWSLRLPDMGTWASQYDESGQLKIDLKHIFAESEAVLETFNHLSTPQCEELGLCQTTSSRLWQK